MAEGLLEETNINFPCVKIRAPYKNRLCSKTCGIDKIYKIDIIYTKSFFIEASEGSKKAFK